MRVETVTSRETVSTCAIEMEIGVGWLLDQVSFWGALWRARRETGVDVMASEGNHIKTHALTYGWYSIVFQI